MSPKKMSSIAHDFNPDMDRLLNDAAHGRITGKLSDFMTRPAYAYTSMQQKKIFPKSGCESCGYFCETEFWKKICIYPFEDPDDYDKAAFEYLPCRRDHEKDG